MKRNPWGFNGPNGPWDVPGTNRRSKNETPPWFFSGTVINMAIEHPFLNAVQIVKSEHGGMSIAMLNSLRIFFGFGHIWASRIHKDGTVLRPFLHRHPAPSHAEIHGLNTNRMRRPRVTMYPRSDFFSCSITINYLNFRHPSPFPSRQVSYLESIWEKYLGQS